MHEQDQELERLLKAERVARERYERLKGYSEDVEAAAFALWKVAEKAVGDYRATHP